MSRSLENFVILDHPYVSDVCEATLARLGVPVLLGSPDVALGDASALRLLGREDFFTAIGRAERPRLYANSEHPLAIIRAGLGPIGCEDRSEAAARLARN